MVRVKSYKYLGVVLHATQSNDIWDNVSGGRCQGGDVCMAEAVYIGDPAMQCKLFDVLVLPILTYACKILAVNSGVGEVAEVLHKSCLKH